MRARAPVLAGWLMGAGCAGGGPGWVQGDIEEDPPADLRDAGIYSCVADREPLEGFVAYEPAWPLWSSGTDKERLLWLPEGTEVDTAEAGWAFPVGTVMVKTFVLDEVPLETRLLYRRASGWDYAEYLWDASGRSASRLEGNWVSESIEVEDAQGAFTYTVPSRLDCRSCHENQESQTGSAVLGISRHQLTDALLDAVPFTPEAAPAAVEGRFPEETAALGYFVGNCTHCHDGGTAENSAFSLLPGDAIATTVEQLEDEGVDYRVAPGNPEGSTLYQVFTGDVASADDAMPPLGIDRRDPDGAGILRAWIEGL